MPVEIIDILKPKNNGDFPVADAEDIAYDETTTIKAKIDVKQDKLVSGTNIKSVNGQSLLGAGNIEIETHEFPTGIKIVGDKLGLANTSTSLQGDTISKTSLREFLGDKYTISEDGDTLVITENW